MTGVINCALWAVEHGFAVFPLQMYRKAPATVNGCLDAVTDPRVVRGWGSWVTGYGIHTEGLYVVDVDAHRDGEATAAGLDLAPTFTVATPRGGRHLYYRWDSEVQPRGSDTLGPGVDVRTGPGHYVVGPGSVVNQPDDDPPCVGTYAVTTDQELVGWQPRYVTPEPRGADRNVTEPKSHLTRAFISAGLRHDQMTRYAGHLARLEARGLAPEESLSLLWMRFQQCEQPPDDPYPWADSERALHDFRAKNVALSPTEFTASELLGLTLPELRWAVDGIVPEGLTLLVGGPKIGKSWLMLDLGLAVAVGGEAFGSIAVEQGGALYLALEDTPRRLQTRMKLLEAQPDDPALEALTLATSWPRMSKGGSDRLHTHLDEHPGTRLVLVDVLQRVRDRQTGDGPTYDADYQAVATLKQIADEHGIAIMVAHHDRKASAKDWLDVASGTKGITGAADAVLLLKRDRDQQHGKLHITGRDIEDDSVRSVRLDGGKWTFTDAPTVLDDTVGALTMSIRDLLRREPGLRPKQIADKVDEKENTIRQTLLRMRKRNELVSGDDGTYSLAPEPVTLRPLPQGEDRNATPPDEPDVIHPDQPTGPARAQFTGLSSADGSSTSSGSTEGDTTQRVCDVCGTTEKITLHEDEAIYRCAEHNPYIWLDLQEGELP
jgi:hypothetical protein